MRTAISRTSIFLFVSFSVLSFEFPVDHSFHPDYHLEWIYFVGHIRSESGRNFGYELSFFRANTPGIGEVFPVHFAISDLDKKIHYPAQTIDRSIGKMAGFEKRKIWSGDFSFLIMKNGNFFIKAIPRDENISLELELSGNSSKGVLLHGEKGFSIKSLSNPSIFSYYYSIPRLATAGSVLIGGELFRITDGNSWMDHEWSARKEVESPSALSGAESSWDWVCINFDDGSDLMAFNFRKDRNSTSESFGTFRDSDATVKKYKKSGDLEFRKTGREFKSNISGIRYPVEWKIRTADLEIEITPAFENQEFDGRKTTGLAYWEGAVYATGIINGKKISGKGYLELKGYTQKKFQIGI